MTAPAGDEDDLPEPPQEGGGLFGDPSTASARAPNPPVSYRVLARKYRPVSFDDMIGQEAMVRVLRRAFAVGRVAHAFMLTGTRGVGKTTTARIIARALACIGPDGKGGPTADPCGVCANCVEILGDRHPDVIEMDAASRTGVDDVREIIESTRSRPMHARAKVFIIDEVHMLSRNAFNALLKTLEEPPTYVTFIFATTELRKVPVTVLSRCQRFDLRRVPQDVLAAHYARIASLEGVQVAPEALMLLARAADGSVRDGLSLLDQAIAQSSSPDGEDGVQAPIDGASVTDMLGLADRGAMFDLLDAIMEGRPADALRIAESAFDRGADPGLVLTDLLDLLHTTSRMKAVPALAQDATMPELERTRGGGLAERLGMPSLLRAWQMLLKGITEVEHAPRRQEAAEMVVIRLCYVADLPPPGELVRRLGNTGVAAGSREASMPSASDAMAPPTRSGNLALAERPAYPPSPAPNPDAPPPPEPQARRAPMPTDWREIVALVAESGREPMLHGHLRHAVHPVRVVAGVVEIRTQARTPRDLAPRLAAVLAAETGTRWTVALSSEPGEPTIAERGDAYEAAARQSAEMHPLVRDIMRAFPGAIVGVVRDADLDAYGLPLALPDVGVALGGAADMPEFAPLDAERSDDIMPPDPEDMPMPSETEERARP